MTFYYNFFFFFLQSTSSSRYLFFFFFRSCWLEKNSWEIFFFLVLKNDFITSSEIHGFQYKAEILYFTFFCQLFRLLRLFFLIFFFIWGLFIIYRNDNWDQFACISAFYNQIINVSSEHFLGYFRVFFFCFFFIK